MAGGRQGDLVDIPGKKRGSRRLVSSVRQGLEEQLRPEKGARGKGLCKSREGSAEDKLGQGAMRE